MKFILKILVVTLLFTLYIQANEYKYTQIIKLSKDEHKIFIVRYENSEKLFKFRWTLYANGGLVVLNSYDRIVSQHLLFKQLKRSTYSVHLRPKGSNYGRVPYVLIKFLEFDYELNKAVFKLYVSDKDSEVNLEHLEDK